MVKLFSSKFVKGRINGLPDVWVYKRIKSLSCLLNNMIIRDGCDTFLIKIYTDNFWQVSTNFNIKSQKQLLFEHKLFLQLFADWDPANQRAGYYSSATTLLFCTFDQTTIKVLLRICLAPTKLYQMWSNYQIRLKVYLFVTGHVATCLQYT